MRYFLTLLLVFTQLSAPLGAQSVMPGYERTGSVYERLALGTAGAERCEALCDGDHACQAWVWTRPDYYGEDAQCALLSSPSTPRLAPGRTTGLSTRLTRQIEASSDRAPTPREIRALQAVDDGPEP
jgi:hypothetical protein